MTAHATYWEDRARRFAGEGQGLSAVCSYGMPLFYNWAIDLTQRRALKRWLCPSPGTHVLDLGCGVGRWSRRMARRGAHVTGCDLSGRMIAEARRRAEEEQLECRFLVSDLAHLNLEERYPLVYGVTVLQHVPDADLDASVERIAAHVAPAGRLVLLEAAPERDDTRLRTENFHARARSQYVAAFRRGGLHPVTYAGVDPAPFKIWLLPRYRTLPRAAALALLFGATAAGLGVDLALQGLLARASWHKVLVFERHG